MVAPSDRPPIERFLAPFAAVTIAEHFRDQGRHAVIIADSTSRWAEAQRELASRTGAIPAEEGYPADLPASLALRAPAALPGGGVEIAYTVPATGHVRLAVFDVSGRLVGGVYRSIDWGERWRPVKGKGTEVHMIKKRPTAAEG